MTPQERIKADAEAYALPMVWVNQNPKGEEQLFYEYISSTSYIAGATAVHDRVQPVIDAAEKVVKIFAHKGDHQTCAICQLARALEQLKGKELQQPEPQPDLGTCVECGIRKAVADYNGHQYHVCDPCNNRLNREFDKEYN